jgi:hypothetical protein
MHSLYDRWARVAVIGSQLHQSEGAGKNHDGLPRRNATRLNPIFCFDQNSSVGGDECTAGWTTYFYLRRRSIRNQSRSGPVGLDIVIHIRPPMPLDSMAVTS